jgi:hypothetical protein
MAGEYDIDRAMELLRADPPVAVIMRVSEPGEWDYLAKLNIDFDTSDKNDWVGPVDLSWPVIAVMEDGVPCFIDGHSRIFRAYRSGIYELPTFVLTDEQASACRLADGERPLAWGRPCE